MPEMKKHNKSKGTALIIEKKLKAMKTNPRALALEMGYAYDHIRKVVRGDVFPSPRLLKQICIRLKLDFDELKEKLDADKAFDAGWVETYANEHPIITDIKRYWPHLTPAQHKEILNLVKVFAEKN